MSCHVSSVNDDDVTFAVGPSFFSFAAGGSMSSMVTSSFDAPSYYIGLPSHALVLKSRHNSLICALE